LVRAGPAVVGAPAGGGVVAGGTPDGSACGPGAAALGGPPGGAARRGPVVRGRGPGLRHHPCAERNAWYGLGRLKRTQRCIVQREREEEREEGATVGD